MSKYPDKIPIICDPHPKSKMPIHKNKFLVPTTLTVGQFGYVIGKRLNTNADIIIYTPKEVVLGRGKIKTKTVNVVRNGIEWSLRKA